MPRHEQKHKQSQSQKSGGSSQASKGRRRSRRGLESATASNDHPGQNERLTRTRCVRCRMLNAKCNQMWPQCDTCKNASVHCMYMPQTDNDRIFGNLPRHRSLGNFSRLPAVQRQSRNWPRMGAAAKEFLVEQPDAHIPENLQDVTENPLRQTADKDRMARLLSGPLKTAIEKHPKENEACTSEGAKDVYKASTLPLPLPLPLPSSELLECISGSIAKEEACMLSPQEPSASLNESMSGSALLALGK